MTGDITFTTAYRMLTVAERRFVDGYVEQLEKTAHRRDEPISNALDRVIPPALVDSSGGFLKRPLVLASITEKVKEIAAESELTDGRVIRELETIAMSNVSDFMRVDEWTGKPVWDFTSVSIEKLAAVKKITHEINGVTGNEKLEIQFHDKIKALTEVLQLRGLRSEDNDYVTARRKRNSEGRNVIVNKGENAGEAYGKFIGVDA